ncbi:hypothetical protein K438DRAFT_1973454 [Mycena galopus ATCC 62051]|nr:hypothetical protein K438DRAFT_1973454 [Mycena galopus ATCC 62051]
MSSGMETYTSIESGALYSAAVLAYLIFGAIPSAAILEEPIFQMMTQVMGIAPTLIIIPVGLECQGYYADEGAPYEHPTFGLRQSNLNKYMPAIPWDVKKGS